MRVLVVTGGNPYPTSLYTLFEGYEDVVWSHATSPQEAFPADLAARFDVIVLHDMHEDLDPALRDHLRAFTEAGKGVVSLHHAIVDYTDWPWWWQEVTGGVFSSRSGRVTRRPLIRKESRWLSLLLDSVLHIG